MTITLPAVTAEIDTLLQRLGVAPERYNSGNLTARTPITGETLGRVTQATTDDTTVAIEVAHAAFLQWRLVPAPKRGELVRLFALELREHKATLARLVSIEVGKIVSEGLGEVQEMIDICDFAVGLSRQLYGLTIATERREHRMMEIWHPLGVTGIISAFNFPVAVFAWNAALALVCGNSIVWKPSEKTPLTSLATHALLQRAMERFAHQAEPVPRSLVGLLLGGRDVGAALADSVHVPLISATGSTAMGRALAPRVAQRFGRYLLELGGNNAAIIGPSADLDLALRGVAFGAMGTAGQRCTSLRRLFVHNSVYGDFVRRLERAYETVSVGNPLDPNTLVGPLIDRGAYESMQRALARARALGGRVFGGNRIASPTGSDAYYVRPAIVEMATQTGPVEEETFAPVLYVMHYDHFDSVLQLHNAVPQGLSSSIFTNDLREAETFVSVRGSDCGMANVNIGPSGAEIGGAFGGEKATGGGRESGSDSWKSYMRRATNTINYGKTLPLAQGVEFDLP
jgi:aldehyde dehydrogenase (NAD+)